MSSFWLNQLLHLKDQQTMRMVYCSDTNSGKSDCKNSSSKRPL